MAIQLIIAAPWTEPLTRLRLRPTRRVCAWVDMRLFQLKRSFLREIHRLHLARTNRADCSGSDRRFMTSSGEPGSMGPRWSKGKTCTIGAGEMLAQSIAEIVTRHVKLTS
jgi:hypothetical protein